MENSNLPEKAYRNIDFLTSKEIFLDKIENTLLFFASSTDFLFFIFDHLLCPDISLI